jgi:predicted GNAT superfamily acetyltransferase
MTSPASSPRPGEIIVRHCHGLKEFEACYQLQLRVWGESNIDVPIPVFVVAAETGGEVLGAFVGDDKDPANMVGFTLAVAGWRPGCPFLHSHMTAVLDAYRDRGIGRKLKLFQRDDGLSRGIELVEWTFDPLETKNAYFNLMRLGAIARRYLPNCYGITSSPLHGSLPTDRLVAEWWLRSPRVVNLLAGARIPQVTSSSKREEVLVPADLPRLKNDSPAEAIRIQTGIREQFQKWFARGYAATNLEVRPEGGAYILEGLEVTI